MSIHFRLRWKERTVSAAIYQCAGGTSGRFVDKKIYFPGRNGSKSLGNDFLWFSRWILYPGCGKSASAPDFIYKRN